MQSCCAIEYAVPASWKRDVFAWNWVLFVFPNVLRGSWMATRAGLAYLASIVARSRLKWGVIVLPASAQADFLCIAANLPPRIGLPHVID